MTDKKQAEFYYLLQSCEKTADGNYELVFMTSDDKHEGNSDGGTPPSYDLEQAFEPYAVNADFELCENTHIAWGPDREKLLENVAYILEEAGGETMSGLENLRLDVTPAKPEMKQYYYVIYNMDEDENMVDFCTSDIPDGIEASRDTPPNRVLRDIFNKHFPREINQRIDIGAAENSHCFYGETPEQMREYAGRIAGVLEAEGFKKCEMHTMLKEEVKPIPPKAPKP